MSAVRVLLVVLMVLVSYVSPQEKEWGRAMVQHAASTVVRCTHGAVPPLRKRRSRGRPLRRRGGRRRLTFRRLMWEYHESVQAAKNKHVPNVDRYWDGSFRISNEGLTQLGYPAPQAITVPANSLVIANTFAFHCRGNAKGNKPRMAIWMQMRDNPFNPLLTPMPTLAYQLNEKVWKYLMRKRDAELTQNGELVTKQAKFER